MSYASHRYGKERAFDCLYDPTYSVPTEKDAHRATMSAVSNSSTTQLYTRYEVMFEEAPLSDRVIFRKRLCDVPPGDISDTTSNSLYMQYGVTRLSGGADRPITSRNIAAPGECKSKACDLSSFRPISATNVNVINVKLSDSQTDTKLQKWNQCKCFVGEQPKRPLHRTRGTQTLYRESSAQTLPYLPEVANTKEELEDMELFKLPTILPGDGPPGLYEVEILERARKRWAFAKALKETFQRQMKEVREKATLTYPKHILEAFEWEQWLQREEYIQECQMMRLDLVIRMFNKREKEMHDTSTKRIEASLEKITAKRQADLRKIQLEYDREMRRLELKRQHIPRNWRKENIIKEFGDPSSEFYAPKMRYGMNPSRRHFRGGRQTFEARMDDLEKQVINMKKLECPLAKLKAWSKPKGRLTEVEQNFCSDDNLKKMYDSLKGLRKQSVKQKIMPKCLIEKVPKESIKSMVETNHTESIVETKKTPTWSTTTILGEESFPKIHSKMIIDEFSGLREQSLKKKRVLNMLLRQKKREEVEAMLVEYEGTTIGWLTRFLSEEMSRLLELRKLHFISMLAQKERWRREAVEAGLRQRENEMRTFYETIYEASNDATTEVCQKYLDDILMIDTRMYAEEMATDTVTQMARQIDLDIERWLKSFDAMQNPMNFDHIRSTLKDIIFPNIDVLLRDKEAKLVVKYIIDKVLFPNVMQLLEPYDISNMIANETVDRLIDNDLFYLSRECSSECDGCEYCQCDIARSEAQAILRKVIRYAVPGRRWRTSTEVIADDNVSDILDDMFVQMKDHSPPLSEHHCKLRSQLGNMDLFSVCEPPSQNELHSSESSLDLIDYVKVTRLDTTDRNTLISVTMSEKIKFLNAEFKVFDNDNDSIDSSETEKTAPLRNIASTFDILSHAGEFFSPSHSGDSTSSQLSIIGIIFSGGKRLSINKKTKKFIHSLIKHIVNEFVPAEEGDSHDSDEILEGIIEEEELEDGDEYENYDTEGYNGELEEDEMECEDDVQNVMRIILKRVLRTIPEDRAESESIISIESGEALFEDDEEEELELVINESELQFMNSIQCKCTKEIDRDNYIKQMLKKGKVHIVHKPKLDTPDEDEDDTVRLSLRTFEYDSIEDEYQTSSELEECMNEVEVKVVRSESNTKPAIIASPSNTVDDSARVSFRFDE